MKLNGIILSSTKFKESSLILNILTTEYGKIPIMCQGAYKKKNHVLGSLDTLSVSEFVLREGRNFYYLDDSYLLKKSKLMTYDLETFYMCHLVSEIILKTLQDDYRIENIYELTEAFVEKIDSALSKTLITSAFILKYVSFMGYRPICDIPGGEMKLVDSGLSEIGKSDGYNTLFLPKKSEAKLFSLILKSTFDELKTLDIRAETIKNVFKMVVIYLQYNLEIRRLNTFEMIKRELWKD